MLIRNLAVLFASPIICAACANDAPAAETPMPQMIALAANESWMGKSLDEWAVEYGRWFYSSTDCTGIPTLDQDGAWCGHNQREDSPVFFFDRSTFVDGTSKLVERTKCQVPAGKAILVPVASYIGDNAGVKQPLPDNRIEALLGDIRSTMRELTLTADGRDIGGLEERGMGPVRFSYHVPPVPNRFGCDDTAAVNDQDVDPSFITGHFVLFEPPSVGHHELEYSSVLTTFGHDLSIHILSKFEVVGTSE